MDPIECSCAGCKSGLEPFTLEHFRAWTRELVLDTGKPWVLEFFQELFADDLFAFTREEIPAECWLVIPEGNGKTTLVAGLALYYLEHVVMAAIPVAAASREQAELVYKQAEGFIVRCPRMHDLEPNLFEQAKGKREMLVPRFESQEGFRRVKFFRGGIIQIRAADESTADGIIPNGLMIIDELHRQRGLGLYRLWLGKGEKRGAPLVTISTAGEPGSEFEEQRGEMRQGDEVSRDECFVRALSESAVLHEWALPEKGNPEDLELVARANPLSTVTVEKLQRKRNKKSWNLAHWRRFTCNLPTRSQISAITEAEWHAAETEERIPEGEPIWVGLDLGWVVDTTGIVPLWIREFSDDELPPAPQIDEETDEETKKRLARRPKLRLFGDAVILEPPRDGTSLDPHEIENALTEIHNVNPIAVVVMDRTRGEQMASWIEENLGAEVVPFAQTNPLACLGYERFTEALRYGWMRHTGHPGFARHVLNAIARVLPGGGIKFERPKESRGGGELQQRTRSVDALDAAWMVHTTATAEPDEEQEPLIAWI